MEQKKKIGLLEELQCLAGCCYLSDLHSGHYADQVAEALELVEPGRYSLKEWEDAYCYILGERKEFGSCGEVWEELKKKSPQTTSHTAS